MRMATDHRPKPRGRRVKIQCMPVMQHIEKLPIHIHHLALGQIQRPFPTIDISPHRCHRSNRLQRRQNFRFAHIARVENSLRTL